MAKARMLLSAQERYALLLQFSSYPYHRLTELIDMGVLQEPLFPYFPYIEGQLLVALMKGLDDYNKGTERTKRKRPEYFKHYVDEVSLNHINQTVLEINAALSRMDGKSSRKPLESDKRLYALLKQVEAGQNLYDIAIDETLSN